MPLKIATWNVNSLRVRLPHVLEWLSLHAPDILCLQETKLLDTDFPLDAIRMAGYDAYFVGQKAYNGVAILTKHRATDILTQIPQSEDPQKRFLSLTIQDIRVVNLYVPNGESTQSQKFQYKLSWLQQLQAYLAREIEQYKKLIILGDFNIAPTEVDVYDPAIFEGQILCTREERENFEKIIGLGFDDCFRLKNQTEKSYSWWDYRMNSFKRNLGVRIDHILASSSLSPFCSHCFIDKTPRALERPSDHAPVVAFFEESLDSDSSLR